MVADAILNSSQGTSRRIRSRSSGLPGFGDPEQEYFADGTATKNSSP
jgi:hypothetical protein